MNKLSQNLRKKTLELTLAVAGQAATEQPQVTSLIDTWLASLEEEDLAGITPESLASVLWEGFSSVSALSAAGCHIRPLRYADGRGGMGQRAAHPEPGHAFPG